MMKRYGFQNGVGEFIFSHGTEHARSVWERTCYGNLFQVESVVGIYSCNPKGSGAAWHR